VNSQIQPSVIKQYMDSRFHQQQINFVHPPYRYEKQLLHAIGQGDLVLAKEVLTTINQLEGATLALQPIRSKQNALVALCTLFTRCIIEGGVVAETAFQLSDAYILEIDKTQKMEQLHRLELEMLAQFIDTLKKEPTDSTYPQVIKLAVSYIHQNILKELSLEIIAQNISVHPNYLSGKFKKVVGISLIEFINKKRIEESTYFLIHTNTSLSDIALLFNFCNQSYYTSLFTKYLGLTPKKYRQMKQPM
jgi:two-component system response regulator YesN